MSYLGLVQELFNLLKNEHFCSLKHEPIWYKSMVLVEWQLILCTSQWTKNVQIADIWCNLFLVLCLFKSLFELLLFFLTQL